MRIHKVISFFFAPLIFSNSLFGQDKTSVGSAGSNDILDSLIGVVIILFILSVINEKITQLIRKYSPFIQKGDRLSNTILASYWKNIGKSKVDDLRMENKIEREVNSLSFFIGLFITVIFCVDLFNMLQISDPRESLYWSKEKWSSYSAKDQWYFRIPLLIISFCLTAFFLTFGSKFFHDLLDLLFQSKNLKRKLADERTFNDPQNIEELEDFIKTPESRLASLAEAQQKDRLLAIDGVVAVGAGYMKIGRERVGCIEIHVTGEDIIPKIEKNQKIKLASGLEVKVPSNIIVTGGFPAIRHGSGGKIANETEVLGFGTLGGIVRDKTTKVKYILSCHHVLNGEINWKGLSQSRKIVLDNGISILPVADLSFGFRTHEFDTALAQLPSSSTLSNEPIGSPTKIRSVEPKDAINETEVTVCGAITGKKMQGFVFNNSWNTKFRYPMKDGAEELWPINDVLVLSSVDGNNLKPLTRGGDSGAFVVDKSNCVIGMVVGGDRKFTYAIKMSKIEEVFNIELA